MDQKKQRQYLRDYTTAARNIELNEAAIRVIESLITREAETAIKVLKRGQQRQLKLLDAAAEKLGAPYGA